MRDGLFACGGIETAPQRRQELEQLMQIAAETEQIADRRISCLKSRAQISDGSCARCSSGRRKNALKCQRVMLTQNHRVGVIQARLRAFLKGR